MYGVGLVEGFGRAGGALFIHIGIICVNVGISFGRMVIFIVAVFAQNCGAGVNT